MKVGLHNIYDLVGKRVILKSLHQGSFHYGEAYTKDWIGQEIFIKNTLSDIQFSDGNISCISYGFEVELIEKGVEQ